MGQLSTMLTDGQSLPSTQTVSSTANVWDHVWEKNLDAAQDDRLLDRERRNLRWALILDRLKNRFGTLKGLRTIELGSGRGDISALLAEQGADITLLDTNERALWQARQRFDRLNLKASYSQDDLFLTSGSTHQKYDVTLSSGVVEHFVGAQRTEAFRAHYDRIIPGGLTIISVPNANCPPYRLWKCFHEVRGTWPYGLELPYTRKEMLQRAEQVGFCNINVNGWGWYHSLSAHILRGLLRFRRVDWVDKRSLFDDRFGATLLMFGERPCHAHSETLGDGGVMGR